MTLSTTINQPISTQIVVLTVGDLRAVMEDVVRELLDQKQTDKVEWMPAPLATAALNVTSNTLRAMARRGQVETCVIGKRTYYRRDHVEALAKIKNPDYDTL